jgi:hypothetical protein
VGMIVFTQANFLPVDTNYIWLTPPPLSSPAVTSLILYICPLKMILQSVEHPV